MGVAFLPFYARLVGMEQYGLVGVFAILQSWITLLDFGLTPTLNREMARLRAGVHGGDSIRDLLRSLEILYVVLAAVMLTAIALGAPWLTRSWLRYDSLPPAEVVQAIRVMGLVLAARWLELIYRGALQGLQDLVWLNAVQVVLASARWGGAYLLLLALPSITVFFAWQGVVSVLSVMVFGWRTYSILPTGSRRPRFAWPALHEVKDFAVGMFVSSLLTFLLTQTDKIVISKKLTLAALGAYTLAANAANGLLQLVLPMNSAVYPQLTEQVARADRRRLVEIYMLSCEWMAAVIVPPALVLTFFAGPVLLTWTGNTELAQTVAPLLAPLAFGTLCNALMNIPYMLQLAYGWTALSVRINTIAVLVMLPAVLWAVARFGSIGAAYAWLALNAASLVVTAHFMYRRLLTELKGTWYLSAVTVPLATGAAIAWAIRWSVELPSRRVMALIMVSTALACIAATVACSLPAVRSSLMRGLKNLQHSS